MGRGAQLRVWGVRAGVRMADGRLRSLMRVRVLVVVLLLLLLVVRRVRRRIGEPRRRRRPRADRPHARARARAPTARARARARTPRARRARRPAVLLLELADEARARRARREVRKRRGVAAAELRVRPARVGPGDAALEVERRAQLGHVHALEVVDLRARGTRVWVRHGAQSKPTIVVPGSEWTRWGGSRSVGLQEARQGQHDVECDRDSSERGTHG